MCCSKCWGMGLLVENGNKGKEELNGILPVAWERLKQWVDHKAWEAAWNGKRQRDAETGGKIRR